MSKKWAAPSDDEIAKAKESWIQAQTTEPIAESIAFSADEMIYTLTLTSGVKIVFPAIAIQEIANFPVDDLADVHISGSGCSIHWETLDVDFSIVGLLRRVLSI